MQGRTGRLIRLMGLLAALAAVFAVAACGQSEDVTITQTSDAAATDEEDQVAELQDEVEDLQDEADETTSTVTTSTEDSSPPPDDGGGTGGVPADAESCGSGVFVQSSTTSCAFGANVADDYFASGGGSFESFSPTTGKTYTMSCSGSSPITCTGGNNALVYIAGS